MGILMGLATMALWGVEIFLAAIANRKLENVIVLFWMQLFGFLLGIGYFLFKFTSFDLNSIYHYLPQLLAVAVLQIGAYLSFYRGLAKGQVSMVSSIGASWGLLTAILGVVFLKEALKANQLIAIIFIAIGIVLVSINLKELINNKKLKLLVGVKEGLIAMACWGVALFLLASLTKSIGWFLPAFLFRLFLLILLAALILFSKKRFVPGKIKFPWGLLLLIGVFDMGAFFTFSLGTSGSFASIVATIGSAYALVTIILAKIFLKEKTEINQYLGITSIVLGLILISL